jgi:hypothetical protein
MSEFPTLLEAQLMLSEFFTEYGEPLKEKDEPFSNTPVGLPAVRANLSCTFHRSQFCVSPICLLLLEMTISCGLLLYVLRII